MKYYNTITGYPNDVTERLNKEILKLTKDGFNNDINVFKIDFIGTRDGVKMCTVIEYTRYAPIDWNHEIDKKFKGMLLNNLNNELNMYDIKHELNCSADVDELNYYILLTRLLK